VRAFRDNWRMLTPALAEVVLALGALIYAGSYGATCSGAATTPVMAHPPFAWPWYAALALVTFGASVAPILVERVYVAQRKPVAAGRGGSGLPGRLPGGSSSL
jgi:hypothetical protein